VLGASEEATIFQTPVWLEACCAAGGFEDASRLYEMADGREIVTPMVRPKRLAAVRPTRSMPDGWGYGGVIAPGRVGPEDIAAVLDDILGSVNSCVVKTGPLTFDAWRPVPARRRSSHRRHIVDIGEGFDALWSEISSGTRNKVRKAEKGGVRVRWGPATELAHLHSSIHLRWAAARARRRGVPVRLAIARAKRDQPLRALMQIAERLGERCRISIATIGDEPVASSVMLFHGDYAHGWRAASLREADTTGYANYLLTARSLQEAAERGHRFVDLGESGGVRSLESFKEHFCAEPRPYDVLLFGSRTATSAAWAWERLLEVGSRRAVDAVARLRDLGRRGRT
jgi:Acetyltransferase (GNAT) domain